VTQPGPKHSGRGREREAARRQADPEGFRERHADAARRSRARRVAAGLTFEELARRSGAPPDSLQREWLAHVLRDEVRRERIEYHSASRRYVPNDGLPADVKAALRGLAATDPDHSRALMPSPRRGRIYRTGPVAATWH
jgi:hypothetical protein